MNTTALLKPEVDWTKEDVDIQRVGKKITLPAEPGPMPIDEAIVALKRKKADEEQELSVHEVIDAFVLEGAVACVTAMREIYGWASPVPKMGFFGPQPPRMVTVQTDVDTYVQVPFGEFKLPNIENNIGITGTYEDGMQKLVIYGKVRKREQHILLELAAHTRAVLKESSIFRNKAITLHTDTDGDLNMETPPTFIDLRKVDLTELVMNRDVEDQIETNIFTPIRKTETVRAARIPLKRGVLLSGQYGVGKTMTTQITAKVCVENDWTFIMVERSANLTHALKFATRYQPCVVFCEDIDRSTEDRDESANDLLNVIDGIVGKNVEIMVVLTTNHVERINPAMLRPGRLDAVIEISAPDCDAVKRLVGIYGRGLVDPTSTLDEIGERLAGQIPASIREVVERSKLAMIKSNLNMISEENLITAATGMEMHMNLLKPKAVEMNVHERLGSAFGDVVANGLLGGDLASISALADKGDINGVKARLSKLVTRVGGELSEMNETLSGVGGGIDQAKKEASKAKQYAEAAYDNTKALKRDVKDIKENI